MSILLRFPKRKTPTRLSSSWRGQPPTAPFPRFPRSSSPQPPLPPPSQPPLLPLFAFPRVRWRGSPGCWPLAPLLLRPGCSSVLASIKGQRLPLLGPPGLPLPPLSPLPVSPSPQAAPPAGGEGLGGRRLPSWLRPQGGEEKRSIGRGRQRAAAAAGVSLSRSQRRRGDRNAGARAGRTEAGEPLEGR